MAFIAPDSDIKILKDVPLDKTYEHTLYFPVQGTGHNEQYTYFNSKVKPNTTYSMGVASGSGATETLNVSFSLTKYSYQRSGDKTIRVEIPSDCLYDCNYIMYRNTAFGDKWFYAFITNAKYINTHVTELSLEIDVIQTWFISNCTLNQCFIERQHSITDNPGDNIVPEGLEIGDEYVLYQQASFDMNAMNICIMVTRDVIGDPDPPSSLIINHVYTPIRIHTVEILDDTAQHISETIQEIDAIIDGLQEDEIICIYQYPRFMGSTIATTPTSATIPSLTLPENPWGLNSEQTVRNKKLLTDPYVHVLVINNCGASAVYKFENSAETGLWTGSKVVKFLVQGVFATTPAVIIAPINYRGFSPVYSTQNPAQIIDYNPDYSSALTYSNFPQCAWSGDTFKAWWAQNKGSFVAGVVSQALGSVGGLTDVGIAYNTPSKNAIASNLSATGSAVNVGLGAISATASALGKTRDMENVPNQTHGQVNTDSLNVGTNRQKFDIFTMVIKPEFAKMVDDFFTKYGYAIKKIGIPNIHARKYWTFVKTLGCSLIGDAPANAVELICSIFDKGITFWDIGQLNTDHESFGDYTLINSIRV